MESRFLGANSPFLELVVAVVDGGNFIINYKNINMESLLLQSTDYDPFKSPPDFTLAFNHAVAARVCKSE